MRRLTITLMFTGWLLSGCAPYEGRYSPNCMAFAGTTIELENGKFLWDQFTDEVHLDDDGHVIDQFPDYPKKGTYRLDGQSVIMTSESGVTMENMYLHIDHDQYFLLSDSELESLERTGKFEGCALVLGGHQSN